MSKVHEEWSFKIDHIDGGPWTLYKTSAQGWTRVNDFDSEAAAELYMQEQLAEPELLTKYYDSTGHPIVSMW